MSKFLLRRVTTGIKFDLRADNGETVATSEVYRTEAACRKGIESVRRCAPQAPVEEQAGTAANPKFQLYTDKGGQFRFRLLSRNGKIIAVSEGYATRHGCLGGIESVRKCARDAHTEHE